jgi:hypothetical protein
MRRGGKVFLALVSLIMIFPPGSLHATTMYIRDWIVVTMRSAPNEGSQAVGSASTSDRVEVLEDSAGWSRIQTRTGAEGWVPARFLSAQPPKSLYVKQLEERIKALQGENMRLKGIKMPEAPVGGPPTAAMGTQGVQAPLVVSGEDYALCKARYEKLLAQSKECTLKNSALDAENSRLKTSERLFFTFIGGIFIVLGVLIGLFIQMASGKPKKQGYRF